MPSGGHDILKITEISYLLYKYIWWCYSILSLEHGRTRYTSNAGLKELRAEISRYLERRMNLRYDPMRQILVTVGGSEAIDMCIRTLVKPGDEVIIPEPCFVCYEPITTLSGGVPVHVACRQEDEFRLRAEALKAAITPKTKLVIMPQLCIEDNGKGYSEKEADSEGIGLKNMQERVTSLGGTLQINGENGFRIFAAIPKQQD